MKGRKMEEKITKKKSKRRLYILLLILFLILISFLIIPPYKWHSPIDARQIGCRVYLRDLLLATSLYAENNQKYPSPKQWCDIVKSYSDEEYNYFLCPSDKTGPCSYAMNENIPADANELPEDLVLLFESAPGWNQTGGVDDVVTDRHGENNPGANIAFADGHVEFIKSEDIPNLRWTVDK